MISNKFCDTLLLHKKLFIREENGVISKSKFIKSCSDGKPKRNKIKANLLTPIEKKENFPINENNKKFQNVSLAATNVFEIKHRSSFKNKEQEVLKQKREHDLNKINSLFFLNYLSYSQSGKALVQISLINHKTPVNLTLWPRQKNFRYKQSILTGEQTENNQRLNLEVLIVGLLSAKVSESFIITNTTEKNILLYTKKTLQQSQSFCLKGNNKFRPILQNKKDHQKGQKKDLINILNLKDSLRLTFSNPLFGLDIEELSRVTLVTTFLVNTCNFYTKQILSRKLNKYFSNINLLEIYEKEKLTFLEQLNLGIENRFPFRAINKSKISEQRPLSNAPRAYWQDKISKELGFNNGNFTDWYRIYIADPEEKSSNIEWVAPDEYYQNHPIKIFKSQYSFNSFDDFANKNKKGKSIDFPFLEQKSDLNEKIIQQNANLKNPPTDNRLDSFDSSLLFRSWQTEQLGHRGQDFLSPGHEKSRPTKELNLSKKKIFFVFPKTDLFCYKDKIKTSFNNKQPVCWNNLDQLDQDFLYHTILMRCFNDAFCLIDENREKLDLIADYLLRFELLRQPKLLKITDF